MDKAKLPSEFARAAAAFRIHLDRLFAPLDLNAGQVAVLASLRGSDGPTQAELARRLGVSAPTVTKMLRTMELRGFVSCERCALDSRAVRVRSTAKAEALGTRIEELWELAGEHFFGRLTPTERLILTQLLEKCFDGR
jgi:DNA-binding MarR family transcriptional regulator